MTLFNPSVLSSREFINGSAQSIHLSSLCVLRVWSFFCHRLFFWAIVMKPSLVFREPKCARCKGIQIVSSSLSVMAGIG